MALCAQGPAARWVVLGVVLGEVLDGGGWAVLCVSMAGHRAQGPAARCVRAAGRHVRRESKQRRRRPVGAVHRAPLARWPAAWQCIRLIASHPALPPPPPRADVAREVGLFKDGGRLVSFIYPAQNKELVDSLAAKKMTVLGEPAAWRRSGCEGQCAESG